MNKTWKTGILLLTLAIPVFIWLFLKHFGQNNFDLPIYYPNGIDSLSDCTNGQQPHTLSAFTFSTTSGKPFIADDFEGKMVISYFLPTSCTDSCELVLERLASIQNIFSGQEHLKIVVFASTAYTQAALMHLEERFNADPELWNFVTGEEEKLQTLKRCGFVLSSAPLHTLVLTDVYKRIRGYYQAIDAEEVDRLKGEIKILNYMQDVTYHDQHSKRK